MTRGGANPLAWQGYIQVDHVLPGTAAKPGQWEGPDWEAAAGAGLFGGAPAAMDAGTGVLLHPQHPSA